MNGKNTERDAALEGCRLITAKELAELLKVDRRTIWRMVARADAGEGSFPQPLRLGARTVRWKLTDIEKYLASL